MRILVFVLMAAAACAQPESTHGWGALGPGASVRGDADGVSLHYELRPKQVALAYLPAPAALAHMRRMRFRVKSDHDTAMGVLLPERAPGGHYVAYFWAPANAWQTIELTPADFAVTDGKNDPVDPDGRLDLDSVESIALLDLAQFFGAMPENPEVPIVIDRPEGAHTFSWTDPEISTGDATAPAVGCIDDFSRGFLQWVTLGGMKLRLSTENPLHAPALQASYPQEEGQVEVLVRRLSNLDLSKASRLSFEIASERESTLMIALEEKDGARHTMTIFPPGQREVFAVNLKLSDFEGAGKIDPSQLKSLMVTDISVAAGGAPGANTIWISKVTTENGAPATPRPQ